MKYSPKIIGLIQAIGVAGYVSVFALGVQLVSEWIRTQHFPANQILSTILFLLAFVVSALICGSIVFVHPIQVFFEGKRKEAIQIVFWNVVWLVVLFGLFALAGLAIINSR